MAEWKKDERGVFRSRCENQAWKVIKDDDGFVTYDGAQLAVLQDIRDELKKLNQLLHCPNAVAIPTILRQIQRNTANPRKRK